MKEAVIGRQRAGGAARLQKRKPRSDGWTTEDEQLFLETLAETCNASEAARTVGRSRAGAYRKRHADPAFDRAWDEAMEQGYAEIELLLMRASLFGSESEEVTTDADGAIKTRKVKRAPNLTVALRLFLAYRDKVARIRERRRSGDPGGGGGAARPDSPQAIAQVNAMMAAIAKKRAATRT